MSQIFIDAFSTMFNAIIQIFIVAFVAGLLVRKDIIKQEYIKGLSEVTVKVLLPAMIFDKVTTTFSPYETQGWWILPLIGFLAPLIFLVFAKLLYPVNTKQNLSKFPVAVFQNAGYLVLPVGKILYPETFDTFALYVFLLILGFNPVLWSIGKIMITNETEKIRIRFRDFITPPLVANLFAISLVFLKLNDNIPQVIASPVAFIGSATVPIATFILGATLGTISIKHLPKFIDILKISAIKYLLIPSAVIFILLKLNLHQTNPLLSDFLVIEASAAPAANLIVMVKKYGGNEHQTAGLMLIAYFEAIIFMPLILAVWKILT